LEIMLQYILYLAPTFSVETFRRKQHENRSYKFTNKLFLLDKPSAVY